MGAADHRTLVERLRAHAQRIPEARAYTFWADGERESGHLTYAALDERARAVAAALQVVAGAGERVLILHPPGLDYISAFWGCLYAGAVAVPAYPPQRESHFKRIETILVDSAARLALTTATIGHDLARLAPDARRLGAQLDIITPEACRDADSWHAPAMSGGELAILQYTSGSTGAPKGVMVTHDNLIANQRMIRAAMELDEQSSFVSWLPPYHDMGLIGNLLQPIYLGTSCTFMPPRAFIERPLRWLEAISRQRARVSGAPSFAYDLVVRRSTIEERRQLDLSSWTVAYDGAEPVRGDVLARFAAAFGDHGFHERALFPCYGLAEATLFVSGSDAQRAPRRFRAARQAYRGERAVASDDHDAIALVGCGRVPLDSDVCIVDPEHRVRCPEQVVGEIWVRGAHVSPGYWRQPDASRATFAARIADDTEAGPYLRTGDLGFFDGTELYITGRLRDLIIIRGRNHYPQDIERTVESCHPALIRGGAAAFAVDGARAERLALVVEWTPPSAHADAAPVIAAIRETVLREHEIGPLAIALIPHGALPRTTSGKVQRRPCRERLLGGRLTLTELWRDDDDEGDDDEEPRFDSDDRVADDTTSSLQQRVIAIVSRVARRSIEQLSGSTSLVALGLDSLQTIELAQQLATILGRAVPLEQLLDAPTVDELIQRLLRPSAVAPVPASAVMTSLQPLLPTERAMWIRHELAPTSTAYIIARAFVIDGECAADSLQARLDALSERHPALRSTITLVDDAPMRRASAQTPILTRRDVCWLDDEELRQLLQADADRPFDLARELPLRACLYVRAPSRHVLLLAVHHLAADLWSMATLIDELFADRPLRRSDGVTRSGARLAEQRRAQLDGERGQALRTFWQAQLDDAAPLTLPCDRPVPSERHRPGAIFRFPLAGETARAIRRVAADAAVTPFVVLLTSFQALLLRYSGQRNFLVATPVADRSAPESADLLGCHVNTIPLRADLDPQATFAAQLVRTAADVRRSLQHAELPFDDIVSAARAARLGLTEQLVQVALVHHKVPTLRCPALARLILERPEATVTLPRSTLRSLPLAHTHAQLDLSLVIAEADDSLSAAFEYDRELFDAATIEQLTAAFQTLLAAVLATPNLRLAELPIVADAALQPLALSGKGAIVDHHERGLWDALTQQARQHADRVAITACDGALTWSTLLVRVERLAAWLWQNGARPGDVIAILLERSLDQLASLLAVLRVGAAWMPLDPDHPSQRTRSMIADGDVHLVMTRHRWAGDVAPTRWLDVEAAATASPPARAPLLALPLDRVAYVMYTSGSSGRPKAVMVSERALCNRLRWMAADCCFDDDEIILQKTAFTFDVSLWELLLPLLVGARLVLLPPGDERDPGRVATALTRDAITTVHFVPSALAALVASEPPIAASALRRCICSGEALSGSLATAAATFMGGRVALYNYYGPTEAAIDVAALHVSTPCEAVSIGRAVANTHLYVLDEEARPLPAGARGQLWIGGIQVGLGYLGRPDFTADRFRPNPFVSDGTLIYATGDRARSDRTGQLWFEGRLDQQLKLRGFRIEPAEIEHALTRHPAVAQAAVVMRGEGLDARLEAFVVLASATPIDSLRRSLSERLPPFMVPAAITVLDRLPTTTSGKLDRGRLPSAQLASTGGAPPRGATERALASSWAAVLGLATVGRDDNFFAIGGDSIRAIRCVAAGARVGLRYSVRDLFARPNVAALAQLVTNRNGGEAAALAPFALLTPDEQARLPAGTEDGYPLSRLQQSLLYLSQTAATYEIYVTSLRVRLPLVPGALDASIAALMQRHPFLRTSMLLDGARPLQYVRAQARAGCAVIDLRDRPASEQQQTIESWLVTERRRRFDWTQGPLLRFTVHHCSSDEFQLTFSEPSLDGWCVATILTELLLDYVAGLRGEPSLATAPQLSYANFVAEEQRAVDSEAAQRFFGAALATSRACTLPRDRRVDCANDSGPHRRQVFHFGADEVRALDDRANQLGLSVKHLLLAAHLRVLRLVHGHDDVVTGLEVSGRLEREDGDRVVGVFNNMVPLRLDLGRVRSVDALARAVYDAEVALLPHRRYPLAELRRQSGGLAPFDAVFVYTHFHVYRSLAALPEIALRDAYASDQTFIPLTVHFNRSPTTAGLQLLLDYDARELRDDQVAQLGSWYRRALAAQGTGDNAPLDDGKVLDAPVKAADSAAIEETAPDPVERIFAQAQRYPDRVAVVAGDAWLTYSQLARRSRALARRLRALGIGPETRVVVVDERTEDLVVSLLAVLVSGAAYVPLDPHNPPARLAQLLDHSGAGWILAGERASARALFGNRLPIIALHEPDQPTGTRASVSVASDDNLAYVLFTSGSSGLPKPVMVTRGGLAGYIDWALRTYSASAETVAPVHTSLAFDLAVTTLWAPLCAGGRVHLLPAGEPDVLARSLNDGERYTLVKITPSHLPLLQGSLSDTRSLIPVRCLVIGGEQLLHESLAWLADRTLDIFNEYGPTETIVGCSAHRVRADEQPGAIPIGHAVDRSSLHLCDGDGAATPAWAWGELSIGGSLLARGYDAQPGLTADRFRPDPRPFARAGARIYQTGDIGWRRPDGLIELGGRRDGQLKVRGVRIEPAEVEHALLRHASVRAAAVTVVEREGQRRLVAWVVLTDDASDVAELRRHLRALLPEPMVPSHVGLIDRLPLTANGKIDRAALPPPPRVGGSRRPPASPLEQQLATIWQQVLNVDMPSIDDDFFALGGDSLRAVAVASRALALGLDVQARLVFEQPTIAQLAATLTSAERPRARRDVQATTQPFALLDEAERRDARARQPDCEDGYPLTPLQEGMLFHTLSDPASNAYCVQMSGRLRAHVDLDELTCAWEDALAQHPILRTCFTWIGLRRPLQLVTPAAALPVERLDWRGQSAAEVTERLERLVARHRQQRFELTRAPLMRLSIATLADDDHVCVWSHHHLLLDGWSQRLLIDDVLARYEARIGGMPVPPPLGPFCDHVAWLQRPQTDADDFWRQELAGIRPTLLPRRSAANATDTYAYCERSKTWSAAESAQVQACAARLRVTVNTLAQAAWALALMRLTGSDDVLFGATISGRQTQRTAAASTLGMCINTLPLRLARPAARRVVEWLRAHQATQAAAREQADVSLRHLATLAGEAGGRLFDSVLVFESLPSAAPQRLAFTDVQAHVREGYPLVAVVFPGEQVAFRVKGAPAWLDEDEVAHLLQSWCRALDELIREPERTVDALWDTLTGSDEQLRRDREASLREAQQRRLLALTRQRRPASGADES